MQRQQSLGPGLLIGVPLQEGAQHQELGATANQGVAVQQLQQPAVLNVPLLRLPAERRRGPPAASTMLDPGLYDLVQLCTHCRIAALFVPTPLIWVLT